MVWAVDYSDRYKDYTVYLKSSNGVTSVTRDAVDLNRVKIGLVIQNPETEI